MRGATRAVCVAAMVFVLLVSNRSAQAQDAEPSEPTEVTTPTETATESSTNDGSWAESPDLLIPVSRPRPVVPVVRPVRERVSNFTMVNAGAGVAIGSLALGGFTGLLVSLLSAIGSSWGPRIDGVGGGEMVFFVSFAPVVGSGVWSAMLLESPPRFGAWPIVFGILSLLGQQAGVALVMAGSFGTSRVAGRPRIDSWVENDGAGLTVRGDF